MCHPTISNKEVPVIDHNLNRLWQHDEDDQSLNVRQWEYQGTELPEHVEYMFATHWEYMEWCMDDPYADNYDPAAGFGVYTHLHGNMNG